MATRFPENFIGRLDAAMSYHMGRNIALKIIMSDPVAVIWEGDLKWFNDNQSVCHNS